MDSVSTTKFIYLKTPQRVLRWQGLDRLPRVARAWSQSDKNQYQQVYPTRDGLTLSEVLDRVKGHFMNSCQEKEYLDK